MTVEIQTQQLSVVIDTCGAELQNVFGKETLIEYLWQGDAQYWAKRSPVLFPIVGGLRSNRYHLGDEQHVMMRHGFARDQEFTLLSQTETTAWFALEDSEASRKIYPFAFQLELGYTVSEDRLIVHYRVTNKGQQEMPFSLGAHPAFNVPFAQGTGFSDYQLVFAEQETPQRWLLDDNGQLSGETKDIPLVDRVIGLQPSLFEKDALVFKQLQSKSISIVSPTHEHGLTMEFEGWPFFGIWSKPGAPFVCLEPWCGIADSTDGPRDFRDKEGIMKLAPGATWANEWQFRVY